MMEREDMLYQPKVVGIALTDKCNFSCIHCYNSSRNLRSDVLTPSQWRQIADTLKRVGVQAINFGGGENPLHPYFIEFTCYLVDLGFKISLTTNGSNTSLERIKHHLHLFDDVGVSLDFPKAEDHDSFRGYIGAWEEATRTVRYLVDRGVNTEIVTCLCSLNCSPSTLQQLYELCVDLKVNYWRLNRFRPVGIGSSNKHLSLSPDQLKRAYEYLSYVRGNTTKIADPLFAALCGGNSHPQGCPCGKTSFRVHSNGDISPCPYIPVVVGNILKDDFASIWYYSPFLVKMRNHELSGKCLECSRKDVCRGGCLGSVYSVYGHFNAPDPQCWRRPGEQPTPKVFPAESPSNTTVHEEYLCTTYVPIRANL